MQSFNLIKIFYLLLSLLLINTYSLRAEKYGEIIHKFYGTIKSAEMKGITMNQGNVIMPPLVLTLEEYPGKRFYAKYNLAAKSGLLRMNKPENVKTPEDIVEITAKGRKVNLTCNYLSDKWYEITDIKIMPK